MGADQRPRRRGPALAAGNAGAAGDFAEKFDEVPVLLALFADLSMLAAVDRDADRYTFAGGASIYPFAWNVLLAARDEGLGGVITTIAIREEDEVKAILGAPDHMALAAVIALGYPVRQPRRLRRQPVSSLLRSIRSTVRHSGFRPGRNVASVKLSQPVANTGSRGGLR